MPNVVNGMLLNSSLDRLMVLSKEEEDAAKQLGKQILLSLCCLQRDEWV
jgi:hypothetical protein